MTLTETIKMLSDDAILILLNKYPEPLSTEDIFRLRNHVNMSWLGYEHAVDLLYREGIVKWDTDFDKYSIADQQIIGVVEGMNDRMKVKAVRAANYLEKKKVAVCYGIIRKMGLNNELGTK